MEVPLAELIVREITGTELNAAEEERVHAWVAENPAHARMLAHFRDAQWRMREWSVYKDVDKEAVWKRMQERVEKGEAPLPELRCREWSGRAPVGRRRRTGRGRSMKLWGLLAGLIFYHNH
jgi:anti-sigma factor RsiW